MDGFLVLFSPIAYRAISGWVHCFVDLLFFVATSLLVPVSMMLQDDYVTLPDYIMTFYYPLDIC